MFFFILINLYGSSNIFIPINPAIIIIVGLKLTCQERLLAYNQGEQELWLFTPVSVRTPIFVLCNISLLPAMLAYQVPGQHTFLLFLLNILFLARSA